MLLIGAVLVGVAASAALAVKAFNENLTYFYNPTQIANGEAPDRAFRVGGLVVDGSVERVPGTLDVRFVLTDTDNEVTVAYDRVLPDLFREGQGIVARGHYDRSRSLFVAEEVLSKHDENYTPPEVATAVEAGKAQAAGGRAQAAGE